MTALVLVERLAADYGGDEPVVMVRRRELFLASDRAGRLTAGEVDTESRDSSQVYSFPSDSGTGWDVVDICARSDGDC